MMENLSISTSHLTQVETKSLKILKPFKSNHLIISKTKLNTNKSQIQSQKPIYIDNKKPLKFLILKEPIIPNSLKISNQHRKSEKKKRAKRASGDIPLDKTLNFPYYSSEFEKPILTHRRGHTTSFFKKTQTQTVTKTKKKTSKTDEIQRTNRPAILFDKTKNQPMKQTSMNKNSKILINKLVRNEQAKYLQGQQPLALRCKFNQSAGLENKKVTSTKSTKKKASKSQMLQKQKMQTKHKRQLSDRMIQERKQLERFQIGKDFLLDKLVNLRSIDNSLLVTQVQRAQDAVQQYSHSKYKKTNPRNRIVIKTDQSIDCLDEIQKFQNYNFKSQFLNDKKDQRIDLMKCSQTRHLIQTYIQLLNQQDYQLQFQQPIHSDGLQQFSMEAKTNSDLSIHKKKSIDSQDLQKCDQILMSPRKKREKFEQNKRQEVRKNCQILNKQSKELKRKSYGSLEQASNLNSSKEQLKEIQKKQAKPRQIVKKYAQQNQHQHYHSLELRNNQNQKCQQEFDQITELKKQQIKKWSYLMEYIKSNMNKEAKSQEVLMNVYEYLSQAKSDLIHEKRLQSNKRHQIKISCNHQDQASQLQDSILSVQLLAELQLKTQIEKNQTSKSLEEKVKIQAKKILDEQVRSFKSQYESEEYDNEIKFMNLKTIESALKNRLKIFSQKRQKQLQKLDQDLQQAKISQKLYQEKKSIIQKWFRNQTQEIFSVKKSIWKGFNQVKGVLGKFFFGESIDILSRSRDSLESSYTMKELSRLQNLKDKKMLKCISETYLSKGKTSYQMLEIMNNPTSLTKQQVQSLSASKDQDQLNSKKQKLRKNKNNLYNKQQVKKEKLDSIHKDNKQTSLTCLNVHLDKSNQNKMETQIINFDQFKINSVSEDQINESFQFPDQTPKYKESTLKISKQTPEEVLSPLLVQQYSPGAVYYDEILKGFDSDSDISLTEKHLVIQDQLSSEYSHDEQDQKKHKQKVILTDQKRSSADNIPINKRIPQKQRNISKIQFQKSLAQFQSIQVSSFQRTPKKKQESYVTAFKYLTSDDKEDIFQFLFLDICIEFYQEPCHENKIMNLINKFIFKQHEMSKRKKGVKTNLNVVKDYLKRLCGYLLRTNKKILANINIPMGPTAIQMLKYMHQNDQFDNDHQIDELQGNTSLIVPIQIFDTFEKSLLPSLQFEKYYEDEEREKERIYFLKNVLHIHNKALFDALNEFLDHERPFGIWGKPFPWKKPCEFIRAFSQTQQQQKLKKSAQKVIQSCSYVCGLLADKEDSLVGNVNVSIGYLQQIREDRMSRMLANEIIQNEERWVFYDDEETETLVEMGEYIYNRILAESIGQFVLLKKRQFFCV